MRRGGKVGNYLRFFWQLDKSRVGDVSSVAVSAISVFIPAPTNEAAALFLGHAVLGTRGQGNNPRPAHEIIRLGVGPAQLEIVVSAPGRNPAVLQDRRGVSPPCLETRDGRVERADDVYGAGPH